MARCQIGPGGPLPHGTDQEADRPAPAVHRRERGAIDGQPQTAPLRDRAETTTANRSSDCTATTWRLRMATRERESERATSSAIRQSGPAACMSTASASTAAAVVDPFARAAYTPAVHSLGTTACVRFRFGRSGGCSTSASPSDRRTPGRCPARDCASPTTGGIAARIPPGPALPTGPPAHLPRSHLVVGGARPTVSATVARLQFTASTLRSSPSRGGRTPHPAFTLHCRRPAVKVRGFAHFALSIHPTHPARTSRRLPPAAAMTLSPALFRPQQGIH